MVNSFPNLDVLVHLTANFTTFEVLQLTVMEESLSLTSPTTEFKYFHLIFSFFLHLGNKDLVMVLFKCQLVLLLTMKVGLVFQIMEVTIFGYFPKMESLF